MSESIEYANKTNFIKSFTFIVIHMLPWPSSKIWYRPGCDDAVCDWKITEGCGRASETRHGFRGLEKRYDHAASALCELWHIYLHSARCSEAETKPKLMWFVPVVSVC